MGPDSEGLSSGPSPGDLTALVADAYREAALQGVDMHKTVAALEAVRDRERQTGSGFEASDAVDAQIGGSDDEGLRSVLDVLRGRVREHLQRASVEEVAKAFAASPQEGWVTWLRVFTAALADWRLQVCAALAAEGFPLPPEGLAADEVKRFVERALDNRWAEALDVLLWLARNQQAPAHNRMRLLVWSAQVQLYHLFENEDARELLEEAQKLEPEDWAVVGAFGEYWLKRNELDRAREFFQRSITLDPVESDGYALMGDTFERQGDLDSAEDWYRETISHKPGETVGYIRLIRLLGRQELLPQREPELAGLLDRAVAIEPLDEYDLYLEMGAVYYQNQRFDEAQVWYDRAVSLDPARMQAYTSKAYAYLDAKDLDATKEQFGKAVEAAPDSFDGYWGLAVTWEQEGSPDQAIEWYRKSLPLRPSWEGVILGRIGDNHLSAGRYDEARDALLQALRLEPEDSGILASLHQLADECYEDDPKVSPEESERIVGEIRQILGESYEASYQNRVANLRYYGSDFAGAAEGYTRAAELDPNDPVFQSNLSLAWERIRQPGHRAEELANAMAALIRAKELGAEEAEDYDLRLAVLRAEQRVLDVYGETGASLSRTVTPIKVDVGPGLESLIVRDGTSDLSEALLRLIDDMRGRIQEDHGVLVPGLLFGTIAEDGAGPGAYAIAVRGIERETGSVPLDRMFFHGSADALEGIPAEARPGPIAGFWLAPSEAAEAKAKGLTIWPPVTYILQHVESLLCTTLDAFLGMDDVAAMLNGVDGADAVAGQPEELASFARCVRLLARERVPLAPLAPIVERFARARGEGLDPSAIAESIRATPETAPHLPGNGPDFTTFALGEDVEGATRASLVGEGARRVLTLSSDRVDELLSAVHRKVLSSKRPALIVADDLRPFLRRMLEDRFPDMPVLARRELLPDVADRLAVTVEVPWGS